MVRSIAGGGEGLGRRSSSASFLVRPSDRLGGRAARKRNGGDISVQPSSGCRATLGPLLESSNSTTAAGPAIFIPSLGRPGGGGHSTAPTALKRVSVMAAAPPEGYCDRRSDQPKSMII